MIQVKLLTLMSFMHEICISQFLTIPKGNSWCKNMKLHSMMYSWHLWLGSALRLSLQETILSIKDVAILKTLSSRMDQKYLGDHYILIWYKPMKKRKWVFRTKHLMKKKYWSEPYKNNKIMVQNKVGILLNSAF